MSSPTPRRLGVVALYLVAASSPVAAQQPAPEGLGLSATASALVSAVVTLVIAGGLLALAPDYAERTTDRIRDDPGETLIYGIGIVIAAFIVTVLLVLTIVGILLVIPMAIVLAVVGYLGFLAAGRAVSDRWAAALAVAVALAVFTGGVPILGGLVGFVLSSMGIGAAYLDYRDDGQRRSRGGRRSDTASRTGRAPGRAGSRTRKRQSGPPSPPGTDARGDDSAEGDGDDPGSPR
jgi:small-conductance mechanosensitive channel